MDKTRKQVILEAFNVYANKGPVNVEGAQMTATRVFRIIKPHLSKEELSELSITVSHALHCGEGRGEFDGIIKQIRQTFEMRII